MSETTVDPSAAVGTPATVVDPVAPQPSEAAPKEVEPTPPLTIRSLLEAGTHFGHQAHRWNPRMRSYLFGTRDGIHIIDLDQTLPALAEALDFLRETTASGGKLLLVGTKRQAAAPIMFAANRANQFYVNNRWLGGMLTNWKTVKKSIDRYKAILEIVHDEEKRSEYSKKELARLGRLKEKYDKSLGGIKEMTRLPDAMFVIDVAREQIAVSEARRLGIPIVAIVDSNCNPEGIDFVVPGNDDAIRAIELYCAHVGDVCMEGAQLHNARLESETIADSGPAGTEGPAPARRVVEIKQAPRRSRRSGSGTGRTASAGGWAERDEAAAPVLAPTVDPPAAPAAPAPAPAAAPAAEALNEGENKQ